ncbi:MAG: hypothetical protein ACLT98_11645 [Eggerthellaceae bacterium]
MPRSSDQGELRRRGYNRRSWCVEAGALPSVAEANPENPGQSGRGQRPFLKRHRDLRIGDFMVQPGTIAMGHEASLLQLSWFGFGMKAAGRVPQGAEFGRFAHGMPSV